MFQQETDSEVELSILKSLKPNQQSHLRPFLTFEVSEQAVDLAHFKLDHEFGITFRAMEAFAFCCARTSIP